MTEVATYRQWLASGVSNREVIELIEFQHPALSEGAFRVANSDRGGLATHEDGTQQQYVAGRFYMTPPETTDTTNQRTTIQMASLDGQIYDTIRKWSFDDRETEITATYRLYYADDLSEPLLTIPPVWFVASMECTLEAVTAELQAIQLRVQRIGRYYTANEFPAMQFL